MYISEFADSGPLVPDLGQEPMNTDQAITFTATAGQSAAFKNTTKLVRISVDGVASILFGTNPTAVANTNRRMGAGAVEYFAVPPGQAYKVSAVITTV